MSQISAENNGPDQMLIDLDGRRLALYAAGVGTPSVVLEAGLTDAADIWGNVRDGIARFTRVWSYDRAGRGASDRAPKPRLIDDAVADLHILLNSAGVPSPYVLVGHSFGGLIIQRYAFCYRDQVAGLALVDSSHPHQTEKILAALPQQGNEDVAFFRTTYREAYEDHEMNVEGFDLATSMRLIAGVPRLGDMPVAVLTAESVFDGVELPPDQIDGLQAAWFRLQEEFSALSTNVSSRVVTGSRHYIFHSHPHDVVSAIRWVVDEVRLRTAQSSQAQPGE